MNHNNGGPASEKTLLDWFAGQALASSNIQNVVVKAGPTKLPTTPTGSPRPCSPRSAAASRRSRRITLINH